MTGDTLTPSERRLEVLRFARDLEHRIERVRGSDKAQKIALRVVREFFDADEAVILVKRPGEQAPEPRLMVPQDVDWTDVAERYVAPARRPKLPDTLLVGAIERRGRHWADLVLRTSGRFAEFHHAEMREVARGLSRAIQALDRARSSEVRARIDRKVIAQIRPEDLFYQILHGLRQLTRYDHSSSILTYDAASDTLHVVAEQIAYRKGKSARVGGKRALDDVGAAALARNDVFGFDRRDDGWQTWLGDDCPSLAAALDLEPSDGTPREGALLCAPLTTPDGLLAVVRVAAVHPGTFGRYEADALRRFVPLAAVAIRMQRRAASLEEGMMAAEKKHMMANLARGVSHDINNALGAVLPLVQQMRADIRAGDRPPEELVSLLQDDLDQIEESVRVCRRIFGGMLSFARGSAKHLGQGDVSQALDATLAILDESMRRARVALSIDVPEDLPRIRGAQGELEQLFLNLTTNARDAMPEGGQLVIAARVADDEHVALTIADTGEGICAEDLARVHEPFFSTRRGGNGLGLSICRSIVWHMGGRLKIDSVQGEGTCVTVLLPTIADSARRLHA